MLSGLSLLLSRRHDSSIARSHNLHAVCCCSPEVSGYRLKALLLTCCSLSSFSFFFPFIPFTLDSFLSVIEKISRTKFTEKFALEQLLILKLYNSSEVIAFEGICDSRPCMECWPWLEKNCANINPSNSKDKKPGHHFNLEMILSYILQSVHYQLDENG